MKYDSYETFKNLLLSFYVTLLLVFLLIGMVFLDNYNSKQVSIQAVTFYPKGTNPGEHKIIHLKDYWLYNSTSITQEDCYEALFIQKNGYEGYVFTPVELKINQKLNIQDIENIQKCKIN